MSDEAADEAGQRGLAHARLVRPLRRAIPGVVPRSAPRPVQRFAPGLALCSLIVLAALGLSHIEMAVLGRPGIGLIFWALILGMGARVLWQPGETFQPGIRLSARRLLEIAVVLFGSMLSLQTIGALGPVLAVVIPLGVLVVVGGSYLCARGLGVSPRMAALIASGNGICGNSAIAAVGAAIKARPAEISGAIALTAVPGLAVALSLPLLGLVFGPNLDLGGAEYGVLAGMLIYALPQVPAATAPLGALAVQMGLLVKLTRVMMLGPVLMVMTLKFAGASDGTGLRQLLPWYVLGFFLLACARATGLVPDPLIAPLGIGATVLTAMAMAALGIETDLRALCSLGRKGLAAALVSVLILLAVSATTALIARMVL